MKALSSRPGPAKWRTDLFAIDDLDQLAGALGLVHDKARTGLADHDHRLTWSTSPSDRSATGPYVTIDVCLECGCEIRNIAAFAAQMKEQRGWNVATTVGWGGSGGRYTIRVQRRTLDAR